MFKAVDRKMINFIMFPLLNKYFIVAPDKLLQRPVIFVEEHSTSRKFRVDVIDAPVTHKLTRKKTYDSMFEWRTRLFCEPMAYPTIEESCSQIFAVVIAKQRSI